MGEYVENPQAFISAALQARVPGRLQVFNMQKITGQAIEALLDGAHNPQAIEVLSKHVNDHLRQTGSHVTRRVTWILAITEGKDYEKILRSLLRPDDSVIAVEFSPVSGMPWVKPVAAKMILHAAQKTTSLREGTVSQDAERALRKAAEMASEGSVVIAGSLYLVSDVLRLMAATGYSEQETGIVSH